MSQPEVLVISAFGRSHWPAAELAEKGFRVQLVDVSHRMGRWVPEDWEGPFGFLQNESLTPSQVARLTEEDYHEDLIDGFTVWPKEGPIDMRGRLVADWVDRLPAYGIAKSYVQKTAGMTAAQREDETDELLMQGFDKNWLTCFAHQLASPVFQPNALSLNSGDPLLLWSPFSIRRVTRKGLQKSLDWCRSHGVEVVAGADLVDVSFDGANLHAVEVGGELARAISPETVIWNLSSAETQYLSPQVASQLFPRGALLPEWTWMRWRVQGSLGVYNDVIPRHMVMIDDLGLPWTHSNMLVVQRCEVEGSFDVWARIPAHHRFQRGYCEDFGQEIISRLNRRLPGFKGSVQDQPQDYHYDASQLGAALFPVYNSAEKKQWAAKRMKNVYFDSAEFLQNLDWTGRFARQNEIVAQLVQWRTQKLAKLAKKGGVSDRPIHAP